MEELFFTYKGHAAGIATSLLWTATSLLFTASAKRIGVTLLNATRICFAIILLTITHRLFQGYWIPFALDKQVWLLAASGVVGLTIGDQALFSAFLEIGPRRAMLVMATSPLWAALFGYLALNETLGASAWLGMGLTVGGVSWVVLERKNDGPTSSKRAYRPSIRGYVLAFIGAACQAGGLMLSKAGMGYGWLESAQLLEPQTATLIRMVFAGLGMIPVLLLHQARKRTVKGASDRALSMTPGISLACCGAVVGPFLGVWMSLVASKYASLGVAQTLCSLSPVFILPFAAVIHKEHISYRAIGGAVMAVFGSIVLFVA